VPHLHEGFDCAPCEHCNLQGLKADSSPQIEGSRPLVSPPSLGVHSLSALIRLIAEEDIASRRGVSEKRRGEQAHADIARLYGAKREIRGIAADEIALNSGRAKHPLAAKAQAVFTNPCGAK